MGFALPSGVVNTDTLYVYATDAELGPHIKQPSDQTLVVVDYSSITPALVLTSYTFSIDVSTNPQLVVAYPEIVSDDSLLFLLSGGIRGQQYRLTITANPDDDARTDILIISIPSTAGCDVINPVPAIYNQIPLWGGGYVNSAVRAFWGEVPPTNPNVLDQWFNTANGKLYERMTDGTTAEWVIIFADDYLTDAPHDGVLYGRKDNIWSPVPISEILFDAPSDGFYYARQNHLWAAVPRIPQPSDIPPLMDAPVPVPGVAIDFARIDHVHPTDSTLYSASNPAGYQTAAQVTATLGAYMPLTGGTFIGAVSFQTAALFASPTNIQIGGGSPSYVLSTNGAGALSWQQPTVGISDAPVDTQTYARNHGNWVNITTATGVPEAPNDGQLWARESLTWVAVPIAGGAGIADAPNDSTTYARRNTSGTGAWRHITHTDITDWAATLAPYALQSGLPAASTTTPLPDGTASIGTSLTYARADHAHPTDTSRYAASNPANYISEAPNDSTVYARKVASGVGAWSHLTHNDITDWTTFTVPVTVSGTAPTTPLTGSLWWNTANQQLYVWSGTAWVITVSPPIIPEAPNDGNAYARRSLGWSRFSHNDITDWAATLGAYLPLSGGVLTGQVNGTILVLTGQAKVGGTLSVVGAGSGAGSYVGFFDGPTTRKGYVGSFGAGGMVLANDATGQNINLSDNGTIYLNGPTQGTSITATGVIHSNSDITAGGNMSCGTIYAQLNTGGTVQAGYLHSTGDSQSDGNGQVNGNFNCSNTISGYTGNFSYSTIYGNQQVNGAINCNTTISAGGQVYGNPINSAGNSFAHGAFFCDNASGGFFQRDSGGNGYMQLYCTSGNVLVVANNRTGHNLTLDNGSSISITAGTAWKPGGGPWANNSDARIKTVHADFTRGLDEVLQLRPVVYSYKGNDTPTAELGGMSPDGLMPHDGSLPYPGSQHYQAAKNQERFVGFIAQEVEPVFPDMVKKKEGYIDGVKVDDLRDLDTNELIFALVNAVKELNAEVQALKAART